MTTETYKIVNGSMAQHVVLTRKNKQGNKRKKSWEKIMAQTRNLYMQTRNFSYDQVEPKQE